MAKGEVKIIIVGDVKKLRSALSDAGAAVGDFDGKAKGFGSSIGSSMAGMAGKVIAAFAAFQVIDKAVGYLSDAAKAAMADAAEQENLAQVYSNVTGATKDQIAALEKWIATTEIAAGIVDSDLRAGMAKLLPATKDVTKAEKALSVAMDVSAARGDSLDTVITALSKAALGQVDSLQRMGIETKKTSGETKTFDELLKDLSSTYGGAMARNAETAEGKMRRLGIAFDNVKEQVGYALLPIIEKFAGWMLDHMPEIQAVVERVAGGIQTAFAWISDKAIPWATQKFRDLKRDAQDPTTSVGKFVDGIAAAVKGVQTVVEALQPVWEAAWPVMVGVFQNAMKVLGPLLGGLGAIISQIVEDTERLFNKPGNFTLGGGGGGVYAGGGLDGPTTTSGARSLFGMASGGIVRRPTVALIGEQGPEAVVPLSRHSLGGGDTFVIKVAGSILTQQQFDRAVIESIRRTRAVAGAVI